jgi:DNA polymerase/3'-5' exonuclease PolX
MQIANESNDLFKMASDSRNWRAVRVDLVPAMTTKFAFALLGWTGSKQYNRSLRLHAKHLGYSLSNTRLYDTKLVCPLSSKKM